MTAPKIKCPDCPKTFATVQLMAMHRRQAHGVVGMSKSSLALRKQKEAKAHAPATPLSFPCTHCDLAFTTANGLAKHQSKTHGIPGQSKSAQQRAAKKALPTPLPQFRCEQCEFTAKSKGGLTHHVTAIHKRSTALAPPREEHPPHHANGKAQGPTLGDGIPEATLALALGRWQGFTQSMATEFDLPPKRFAARLAELIYATAVR
jgi:uncharacterized C2H2 Zn-finger protein